MHYTYVKNNRKLDSYGLEIGEKLELEEGHDYCSYCLFNKNKKITVNWFLLNEFFEQV